MNASQQGQESGTSDGSAAENLGRSRIDVSLWSDAASKVLIGEADVTATPPPPIR